MSAVLARTFDTRYLPRDISILLMTAIKITSIDMRHKNRHASISRRTDSGCLNILRNQK